MEPTATATVSDDVTYDDTHQEYYNYSSTYNYTYPYTYDDNEAYNYSGYEYPEWEFYGDSGDTGDSGDYAVSLSPDPLREIGYGGLIPGVNYSAVLNHTAAGSGLYNGTVWNPKDYFFEVVINKAYVIPPAIIAGVVAGSALWLVFIAVYKLLLKRLRPRRRQQVEGGIGEEGSDEDIASAEAKNNNSLHQIASIPRARLSSSVHGSSSKGAISAGSLKKTDRSMTTTSTSSSSVVKVNPSPSSSSSPSGGTSSGNSRGSPRSALQDSGRESGTPSPASSEMEMGSLAAKR